MSLTDSLLLDPLAPPRVDIWVALRTDGAKGSGTEADPYDGSTWASPIVVVSNLARSSNVATAAVPVGHGFKNGDLLVISGATGADGIYYNGPYLIYNVSGTSFQYTMWGVPQVSPATGTITCRLTPYRFDAVMTALPASRPTAVHLGPGVFETRGYGIDINLGWPPRSGGKLAGSGMGVTTLKLVGADIPVLHYVAIGYDGFLDGYEVCDLTIDCNLSGQPVPVGADFAPVACGAVGLRGSHIHLRRIRAINFGTQSPVQNFRECFVIFLGRGGPGLPEAIDCIVEDCLVEQPSLNNTHITSCIAMGGNGEKGSYHRACAVRNCVVDCAYPGGVSSHLLAITGLTHIGTGNQYELETNREHGRTTANNVRVNGIMVWIAGSWQESVIFNGSFKIDSVPSPTKIRYTLLSGPDGDPVMGQNVATASIGVPFHGIGVSGGTGAVLEGCRVARTRFANYGDTYSSKDFVVRNNYFRDVVCGIYHSMGDWGTLFPGSTLTRSGNVATFTAPVPHGLLPWSAVSVQGALVGGNPLNPFNGLFALNSVPASPADAQGRPLSFRYVMPGVPSSDASGSFQYRELWRIKQLLAENNVIELAPSLPGSSAGIELVDNFQRIGATEVFLEVVLRRNVIRTLDDVADPNALGIYIHRVKAGLIEENVLAAEVGEPFRQTSCGPLAYLENRTPSGVLLQGVDFPSGRRIEELATLVEDATIAAF